MGAACGTANQNSRSGRRQVRARDRINERRMRQHLQDDSSASENESEPTTTMESSSHITSPNDCVVTWHGEEGAPPGLSSPVSPPTSPKPGQKEDPLTALRDDQRARLERVLRGTSAGAQGPNGGRPKIPPRRPSLVRRPSLQPHLARPGALNSPLQPPLSNNFLGTEAQNSNAGDQDSHNMLLVENASFGGTSMLPTPKNLSTTGSFAGGGPPIFASVPESGNTPDQKALNNNADDEGFETATPLGAAISTARGGEGPGDERPLAFSPIEDQHSGNTARGEAQ